MSVSVTRSDEGKYSRLILTRHLNARIFDFYMFMHNCLPIGRKIVLWAKYKLTGLFCILLFSGCRSFSFFAPAIFPSLSSHFPAKKSSDRNFQYVRYIHDGIRSGFTVSLLPSGIGGIVYMQLLRHEPARNALLFSLLFQISGKYTSLSHIFSLPLSFSTRILCVLNYILS